jgi:hypothetical protein
LLGPATDVALALLGSEGCVPLSDVASGSGLSREVVQAYLSRIEEAGGLRLEGDSACPLNRAILAAAAVRLGADPEAVSRLLSWRDFEGLVAEALSEAGLRVWRNLRVPGRGGLEVDVLGLEGDRGVVVDCKRWSYRSSSPSRIAEAASRHVERVMRLIALWGSLGLPGTPRRLLPALVVLREDLPKVVNGVAVVPVLQLSGFTRELEAVIDELGIDTGL